jgi:TonB family protein
MTISTVRSALALASALALVAVAEGQEPVAPKIAPWNAASHVGEVATVCGRVVAISCQPGRALLEMDPAYWAGGVDIVVTAADQLALGVRVGGFLLQQVCAVGTLGKGVLTRPSQVVVQEPATRLPAAFEEAFTACDAGVTPPTLVRDVKPQYTPEAMRAKKVGKIRLNAVVLPTGAVGDIVVAVSLDSEHGLDHEAVTALRRWRFKPGTRSGRPASVIVSVEMAFSLGKE